MELKLANSSKTVGLTEEVFACPFNEALIHQIITAYLAGGRAGTSAQKTRAEVSGGGIKPWRQKGTGRARAGTIRSPLWRKGGVTFAAKPRSYKQKVNKKMYRGGLCSIISESIRQERWLIVEDFQADTPKTKQMLIKLQALNLKLTSKVLIISNAIDENLYLALRNIPHIEITDPITALANPVLFVKAEQVVVTEAAIKELEELLK